MTYIRSIQDLFIRHMWVVPCGEPASWKDSIIDQKIFGRCGKYILSIKDVRHPLERNNAYIKELDP